MPTFPSKERKLLKDGKTKVVRTDVFTIQLVTQSGESKQEVVSRIDSGSKTIGCAAIANGKVLYQSEVDLRQDISKKNGEEKNVSKK